MFRNNYRDELIKKIKYLRDHGGTFEEIKDYFNSSDIKTVRGYQWHTQSLHAFYKRHSI